MNQLIDNLYTAAVEYREKYKGLPNEFVWYAVGSGWHHPGISSTSVDDFLDYCRTSFTEMKERLEKQP